MIGNNRPATASIAIGVVVLLSFDAAHCRQVYGFSSVRHRLSAPSTLDPPPLLNAATIDAAEEVWRCKRCNGGGLIAPGACCQTCAGDGIRVEWDDDGSDLRPLIDALAALDQEAPA